MPPERQQRLDDHARKVVAIAPAPALIWKGPEYPVVAPGIYSATASKVQGPQWVRSYRRWSMRLEFCLLDGLVSVSAFFNLGDNPLAPHIGRQSRYYKAWVLANDGHPARRQKMSAEVFFENQIFEVEVADCNRDEQGNPKPDAEAYSRVVRVISAVRP